MHTPLARNTPWSDSELDTAKKNELRKVWLRCDKGGKYEIKGSGKRDTSTRQTECSFGLIAFRDLETSQWACVVKDSDHNH